ncbi:hypothetical protein M9194_06210 [Vibrio sp. S4M6]|uniref:hypothetical protein n=1 Tax=Vibrio sinus TaxID=2946865 RepID=UPI002029EA31|nr:hypothetical protein [Vibrio sinus]MCL9781017.1 hypothetical protein [Vibrio sinus]
MMKLLTGKYGVAAFGMIGLAAAFAIFLIIYKLYKKNGKKLATAGKALEKVRPSKSDITNTIKQIKSRLTEQPAATFLYLHDGSNDAALEHIFQYLDKNSCDVYFDDPLQPIVVGEQQVLLLAQFSNLAKLDVSRLNLLLDKLYKQGVIQMPKVSVHLKQKPIDPGLSASMLRFLPRVNLLSKQDYQVHFLSDNAPIQNTLPELLNLDNSAPYIDFSDCQNSEALAESAKQHFQSLHNQFSFFMTTESIDSNALTKAMSASQYLEKYYKQIESVIAGLIDPEQLRNRPQQLTLNYGIDPSNLRDQFFYSGTNKAGKSLSAKHVLVGGICLLSAVVSGGLIYNGVQKIQLDEAINQAAPFVPQTLPLVTAEQNYQRWSELYHSRLIFGRYYPNSLEKTLNLQYAGYLLSHLNTQYQETTDPLNRALYLMIFAAGHDAKIQSELSQYQSLLTQITGFSSQQLELVYRYAKQPINQISTLGLSSNQIDNQLEVSNTLMTNVMPSDQVLGQLFSNIQLNITNAQLLRLLTQSVVMQQKLAVLHNSIPQALASVYQSRDDISSYLGQIADHFPSSAKMSYSDLNSALTNLQNIIPKQVPTITGFDTLVSNVATYNEKIGAYLKQQKRLDPQDSRRIHQVLLEAELNTVLDAIMNSNDSDLTLLSRQNYYNYTYKTVFSRNVTQVSLVYSKSVLLRTVLPLIEQYKALSQTLTQLNIQHDAFDYIESQTLLRYSDNYVLMLNKLLKNALPHQVSLDNLHLFLMDLTYDDTPLSNMLKYISKNTTFGKDQITQPELQQIPQQFAQLNAFIRSKGYKDYQSIISSISNSLYNKSPETYQALYLQLKPGTQGSLMDKLNQISSSQSNPEVYQLLNFPVTIVRQTVADYLIQQLISQWQQDVTTKVSYIENGFPLNMHANYKLDGQELTNQIGINGQLYLQMNQLLSAFIHLNGPKTRWLINTDLTDTQQSELAPLVTQLNKIYRIQQALWKPDGTPKAIKVSVKALPFEHVTLDGENKMALSFFQLGQKSRVIGLNTNDQPMRTITYDWQSQPTVSVGWLSNQNQSYQDSINGEWALFQLLNEGKCKKDNICQWGVKSDNTKVAPYTVSFKVTTPFLSVLNG